MSATSRPRGALPRRVYWVRRTVVLLVAFALVLGIGKLLGTTGADSGRDRATPVGASRSATPTVGASPGPTAAVEAPERRKGPEVDRRRERLPRAQGPCDDADVLVRPGIQEAHAGSEVEIVLELTTAKAAACTWRVSPESVFLTITSENGVIWSSQECPAAIPEQTVVPRREWAARVTVAGDGRESDAECSVFSPWVLSGTYTATAVARGSVTPIESGFVLGSAVQPTTTQPATPSPTAEEDRGGRG